MILKMKNDPLIDYFEGSVDEYEKIKDDLFPRMIDISNIPNVLGDDLVTRLDHFMKFRNDGIILYDSIK